MSSDKPRFGLRLLIFLFGSFKLDPLHYIVKCREHGYQLARLNGYDRVLTCVKCFEEIEKKEEGKLVA